MCFLDWVARIYVYFLQWRYFPLVFEVISDTRAAGYDDSTVNQRADEAMGLAILDFCLTRDCRIVAVRPLTPWETIRAIRIGDLVIQLLASAGWTGSRIKRRAEQIQQKVRAELFW